MTDTSDNHFSLVDTCDVVGKVTFWKHW